MSTAIRNVMLDKLKTLNSTQIDELIFRYAVPANLIPREANIISKALVFIRYAEQEDKKLSKLSYMLDEILGQKSQLQSYPSRQDVVNKKLIVGIDVGTAKIASGVIEFNETTMGYNEFPRKIIEHNNIAIGEPNLVDRLAFIVKETVYHSGLELNDIYRVGIGLPGQVDYNLGLLKYAPGLRLRDIQVSQKLRRKLKIDVRCDNDVNCSTLAELKYGYGKQFSNFVCVFVGFGIGAGIVHNSSLVHGDAFAGEVGHIKIDCSDSARLCTCESRGCFEEYASARAIKEFASTKIRYVKERKIDSLLMSMDADSVTPEDIVSALEKGDLIALELAEQIAKYLALGLSNIVHVIHPKAIILGGGIIDGFYNLDFFVSLVAKFFKENTLNALSNTQLLRTEFEGKTASILGASLLCLDE